jgi:signal transduction histidine kinase
VVIQNAREDTRCVSLPPLRLGLTRYLGVPIYNPAGDVIGTLCFLDGKSEKLLGEADLQFAALLAMRVGAELERERAVQERLAVERAMVEELAAANERLRIAAEEKRHMMAAVVHDLRQPLTTMRTVLYLLRDEADPRERDECVTLLEGRVAILAAMIEDLLQYAEIESGRTPWRIERLDLGEMLHACLDAFLPALAEKQLTLRREIAPDLGEIETDRTKLAHVVNNLLANAAKFTHAGSVTVRARALGERWQLEVADTGVGIPAEELSRIFDEFYQAGGQDPTGSAALPSGRGLGLAIVRHLCGAFSAEIAVESEPGTGTCFRLLFPYRSPP